MYGTTTAADATMNERYFSLYAKGKTPPGSSTPAAEARDAGDDAPQRKWNHLPVDSIRAEFPALTDANHDGWAFMENAGGSQVPRRVADAMQKLLAKNPAETFLIEGHTDAVGSDLANLALSDRRAEAVANALTNVFDIPPENLTTQGYGERYLKINTQKPERENRRVAIRRITPLVAPVANAK